MRRALLLMLFTLFCTGFVFVDNAYACTTTPLPPPPLTSTPDANGTIAPTPTSTPIPTPITAIEMMETKVAGTDFIAAGNMVMIDDQGYAQDYAVLIDDVYKGDTKGAVAFRYLQNPCGTYRSLPTTGTPVIVFHDRSLNNPQNLVAFTDDLHNDLVTVIGTEPQPIMYMTFPLVIIFFGVNFSLWMIVVGRRLARGDDT